MLREIFALDLKWTSQYMNCSPCTVSLATFVWTNFPLNDVCVR